MEKSVTNSKVKRIPEDGSIIEYDTALNVVTDLKFENFTVKDGIKNWSYQCQHPTILVLFGKEEDKLNNILKGIAGINNVIAGKIFLNNKNITYHPIGWNRQISYFSNSNKYYGNKLFSVQYNLVKIGTKNTDFLKEVKNNNRSVKAKIASWKNTDLLLDREYFKMKVINLVKQFIEETESTRNMLIKEYEEKINHFHEEFAQNNFNFSGSIKLVEILIKKLHAEEDNIIANNNLLFYQSLFDRIASLTNLVDDCFCGCNPPKERQKHFKLKELTYALKEIGYYINEKIDEARKIIKITLKRCNIHNQHYHEVLSDLLAYKKITISRAEIEEKLEKWVDVAEIQRIKFNMKQDFLAMQILPDEMNTLIKTVKNEIKLFHEKLLSNPEIQDVKVYQTHLQELEKKLISPRAVVNVNIHKIFELLNLSALLSKKYANLNSIERRIVLIIQQIVLVHKVLVLENPFELLNDADKKTLANYLKIIVEKLKIVIIFASKHQKDIDLIASDIIVIENEVAIQQGILDDVKNKPLSLTFLKESFQNHLNILESSWIKPHLAFAGVTIATLPEVTIAPIIAVAANDIVFTLKKPRFNFLKKIIIIVGKVKNINKIDAKAAYLIVSTNDKQLIEIFVTDLANISIDTKGWLIIKKNSFYIFDGKTHQLLNTW